MANFLDNFRQIIEAAPVNDYPAGQEDTSVPSTEEYRNNQDWQNRVAMPFSYEDGKNGKRAYGILYLPNSAAWEINQNGSVNTDELEVYGAETMDGQSLTTKGVQDLFKKYGKSFQIESSLVPDYDSAQLRRSSDVSIYGVNGPKYNPIPGVLAENTNALRRLQNSVINAQDQQLNRASDMRQKFPLQNNFINYLRETRKGGF